jgi:hypothetical protein
VFTKYRNLNLSLIPVRPGQKKPLEFGWTQFCNRLPTAAEAAAWDRGSYGFGIALGPASKLLAVDIDTDDPNVLNACKISPVRKRGKKGETRFFQFCPEIPSTKIAGCIDILSKGRHTVLPPSIHPDTGQPYVWLTSNTLENFQVSNLPEFRPHDLEAISKKLEPRLETTRNFQESNWQSIPSGAIGEGARNSKLASLIGGLLRSGLHPRDVFEYVTHLNANKFHPPLQAFELETVMVSIMKREYLRRTSRLK